MKFLICGRTGTGKDTLQSILVNDYGWKGVKSYSTRAKRFEDEDTHIFISKEEADAIPKSEKVAVTFIKNGDTENEYFATRKQVNNADVYIIDPIGIKELVKNMPEENFIIVYLKANDYDTQRQMVVSRADNETLAKKIFVKRFHSEDRQFSEFEKLISNCTQLAPNCYRYISFVNEYKEDQIRDFAQQLNNLRTIYNNLVKITSAVRKSGGMCQTDEKGRTRVIFRNMKPKWLNDEQFTYLLLEDSEGIFSIMNSWLRLDETTALLQNI